MNLSLNITDPLQECVNDCQRQLADVVNRMNMAYGWMIVVSFVGVVILAITYQMRQRRMRKEGYVIHEMNAFEKYCKWILFILIISSGWLLERFVVRMLGG